jgi:hypothetical protein
MNSKPQHRLLHGGESPLSDAAALWQETRDVHGQVRREQGRQGDTRLAVAMLSVPTLWTVFVVNFLALGLIWTYVARSYPRFEAARFWTGSAYAAAAGAAMATLRQADTAALLPLLAGGTTMIFAA